MSVKTLFLEPESGKKYSPQLISVDCTVSQAAKEFNISLKDAYVIIAQNTYKDHNVTLKHIISELKLSDLPFLPIRIIRKAIGGS